MYVVLVDTCGIALLIVPIFTQVDDEDSGDDSHENDGTVLVLAPCFLQTHHCSTKVTCCPLLEVAPTPVYGDLEFLLGAAVALGLSQNDVTFRRVM